MLISATYSKLGRARLMIVHDLYFKTIPQQIRRQALDQPRQNRNDQPDPQDVEKQGDKDEAEGGLARDHSRQSGLADGGFAAGTSDPDDPAQRLHALLDFRPRGLVGAREAKPLTAE